MAGDILPAWFGDPVLNEAIATDMLNEAKGLEQTIKDIIGNLATPVINPVFPTVGHPPDPLRADLPALIEVRWDVPSLPGPFTQTPPDTSAIPTDFTQAQPSLNIPTAPLPDYGTAPDAPAIQTRFEFPELTLTLPNAPDLLQVNQVRFSGVDIPTFDMQAPTLTMVEPEPVIYQEAPVYTSQLLTSLTEDLRAAIANGTNLDLPQSIYTAKWDAAREREYRQQADALLELDRMEEMGFAFPPGVFLDARIKLQTETNNTIAGLNREIMVKSAELTLDNLVKAREQAAQLETKWIDYFNQVNQRQFEAAKYMTEARIQIYNAAVQRLVANAEVYKAAAQAYDYQIRGQIARVEAFKAEVEAEQTKAQINQALVAQYKAQIDAAMARVEIYKTEVHTIEVQANVQKLLVEIFGEQTRAFVSRVNAFTAQVEAYKAGVEGETAKQTAYRSAVEAFKARVEAAVSAINARIEGYKAQVLGYTTQIDGFKAAVTGMAEQARAAASYNTAEAEVYKAEVQGLSAYNETLTKQWQAAIEEGARIAQVAVSAADANGKLYIATRGLALDGAKSAAQVAAQLGAAALNAIHFTNSASFSRSLSDSNARSVSQVQSTSQSSSTSNSNSNTTSNSQITSYNTNINNNTNS